MTEISPTDHQWQAIKDTVAAVQSGCRLVKLTGFAGTGKTTIVRHLLAALGWQEGTTAFMAPTGRAASVMRSMHSLPAATIHRALFHVEDVLVPVPFNVDEQKRIALGENVLQRYREKPVFRLNPEALDFCKGALVDEGSMVGPFLVKALASFNVPIVTIGDPFQLPPVESPGERVECGYGSLLESSVQGGQLTEVHRQAFDNPIIRIATSVREQGDAFMALKENPGRPLVYWGNLHTPVIRDAMRNAMFPDGGDYNSAEALLTMTGTRKLALQVNRAARSAQRYDLFDMPHAGERIIIRMNSPNDRPLFNGDTRQTATDWYIKKDAAEGYVIDPDTGKQELLRLDREWLLEPDIDNRPHRMQLISKGMECGTFGYASTVHSAQGGQAETAIVFNQGKCFNGHESKWNYTAITRAEKRLIFVTGGWNALSKPWQLVGVPPGWL